MLCLLPIMLFSNSQNILRLIIPNKCSYILVSMHCPLFSRAWGPKVGIKIYEINEYSLAIAKSIYDTEVVNCKEYSIQ